MTIKIIPQQLNFRSIESIAYTLNNWRIVLGLRLNRDKIKHKLEKIAGNSSYLLIDDSNMREKKWKVYKLADQTSKNSLARIIKKRKSDRFVEILKKIRGGKGEYLFEYLKELPVSVLRHEELHCDLGGKKIKINSIERSSGAYYQELRKENSDKNLVIIILDALSIESVKTDNILTEWSNKNGFMKGDAYSPSTVTGASLPSFHMAIPHMDLLIDDYEKWFYDKDLERIDVKKRTVAEVLSEHTTHNAAITAFGKSHPFYGYFRGYDYYENTNAAKNIYSPSSLDKYNWYYNNSFGGKYPSGHYTFIHDIGVHPPLATVVELNGNKNTAYHYALCEALKKVELLIKSYEMNGQIENTTFVITADHGASHFKGHSRKEVRPYPAKVRVPLLYRGDKFRGNKTLDGNKTTCLEAMKMIYTQVYRTEEYDTDRSYEEEQIKWLSSCADYENRRFIYILGYDFTKGEYVMVKILRSEIKARIIRYLTAERITNKEGSGGKIINNESEINKLRRSLTEYYQESNK